MDERKAQDTFDASFFTNYACPYLPCHEGIDVAEFNCLFCYCPLYALGDGCGGDFSYTPSGTKDCSACGRLHRGKVGAAIVKERFGELRELGRRRASTRDEGQI